MTIKSVVGTYDKSKPGYNLGAGVVDTLSSDYESGSASLRYDSGSGKLAIDEDTVAFYYDATNPKDVKYGVAVGYSKMANVDKNTSFMSQKVGTTNLADVVLFNDEGVVAAKDYIYILGRNDHSSSGKYVEVYGVLEDGTAATLKITRDNYEDMDLDDKDTMYYSVFAYTTNSDDISTLSNPASDIVLNGYGLMLTNRTVAFDTKHTADDPLTKSDYTDSYALPSSAKVWNVTDIDEGDDAPAGSFSTNKVKHTILVLDSTKTKIETAFVWDLEIEDTPDPVNPEIQIISDDAANDYENPAFYISDGRKLGTREMRNALAAEMRKDDCTDIKWDNDTVSYVDADGTEMKITVNFDKAQVYKVNDSYYRVGDKVGTNAPVKGEEVKLTGHYYFVNEKIDANAEKVSDGYTVTATDVKLLDGYYKVTVGSNTVANLGTNAVTWTVDGNEVDASSGTYVKPGASIVAEIAITTHTTGTSVGGSLTAKLNGNADTGAAVSGLDASEMTGGDIDDGVITFETSKVLDGKTITITFTNTTANDFTASLDATAGS